MGGPTTKRMISQEAFDEVVRENMQDFEMEAAEALQDAIDSLTLQGVDLSGKKLSSKLALILQNRNYLI